MPQNETTVAADPTHPKVAVAPLVRQHPRRRPTLNEDLDRGTVIDLVEFCVNHLWQSGPARESTTGRSHIWDALDDPASQRAAFSLSTSGSR
jgi:hypothetical protein